LILSQQFSGSHICVPKHRYGGGFGTLKIIPWGIELKFHGNNVSSDQ